MATVVPLLHPSPLVRNHDRRTSANAAEAGDDAGRGSLAVVLIVGDQHPDVEPRAVLVEQRGHALARGEFSLVVLAFDALGAPSLFEARADLLVLGAERLEATHAATCSAAHSWMYLMRSDVGVPGPNSLPVPCPSNAVMSSGGMMPPPVSSTSCRPAASSSFRTRGNNVMCAPESTDSPTTSTSS